MKITKSYLKQIIKEELENISEAEGDTVNAKYSAISTDYPSISKNDAAEAFDIDSFITRLKIQNPSITPEEISKLIVAQGKNKSPVIPKMNSDLAKVPQKPGSPRATVKDTLNKVK